MLLKLLFPIVCCGCYRWLSSSIPLCSSCLQKIPVSSKCAFWKNTHFSLYAINHILTAPTKQVAAFWWFLWREFDFDAPREIIVCDLSKELEVWLNVFCNPKGGKKLFLGKRAPSSHKNEGVCWGFIE